MRVVVFGGTGVVGRSVAEHLVAEPGVHVTAISRRPVDLPGVRHVAVDLADRAAAARALGRDAFAGTTHVVFAALQESAELVGGWRDPALIAHNLSLFRNAVVPLVDAHGSMLEHASLLQGAKAYGFHAGRSPLPAKERAPRDEHDNFYFLQEDVLREVSAGAAWSWTVLRPQVVYGASFGSPMNLLPAIGVYAAVERAAGRPLSFPGGPPAVQEAVDARLLARALRWAATAPEARGEIFNVTNGDVFSWHDVWPTIADVLGMAVGPPRLHRLAETMPARAGEWAAVVDRHRLRSPRSMVDFVGGSWTYADIMFGSLGTRPVPALLSTTKIRQAGFRDCVDTEDMFREWLGRFQEEGLLPPR